jgi:hypothetical protein
MRPFTLFRMLMLVLVLWSACCWAPATNPVVPHSWDVLSTEEFESQNHATAMFLVQRFRPSWLSGREHRPFEVEGWFDHRSKVRLYVDGIPSTLGLEALKTIPGEHVLEIRYLTPMDATTRYGTGHSNGAILVITVAGEIERSL